MDLRIIGKYISEKRKVKGLTQVKLAEILHVSEKTISKWECGNGFPDTTLMLPLCEALDISANELLSGKSLSTDDYKYNAEQNLLELKRMQENSTKHLLMLEWVVGYLSTFVFLISMVAASFATDNLVWRIVLIVFGSINFLVGILLTLKIEKDAGYYVCAHCLNKYIPSYKQVLFSMHYGRTRYMRCPKCGKRTWNKKTIK